MLACEDTHTLSPFVFTNFTRFIFYLHDVTVYSATSLQSNGPQEFLRYNEYTLKTSVAMTTIIHKGKSGLELLYLTVPRLL
jgi:hypothetical protein